MSAASHNLKQAGDYSHCSGHTTIGYCFALAFIPYELHVSIKVKYVCTTRNVVKRSYVRCDLVEHYGQFALCLAGSGGIVDVCNQKPFYAFP